MSARQQSINMPKIVAKSTGQINEEAVDINCNFVIFSILTSKQSAGTATALA